MQAMHDRFPAAIEEEIELPRPRLRELCTGGHARASRSGVTSTSGLDQHQHYAYLRTVLKALTFLRGPRQWVLKRRSTRNSSAH